MTVLIITGYILSGLISVFLLILLTVIFIPFRYRSEGSYFDNSGRAFAVVKWISGAFAFRYDVEKTSGHRFEMILFWIIPVRIKASFKKEKKKPEKKKSEKEKKRAKRTLTKKGIKMIIKGINRIVRSYMPKTFKLKAFIGFEDTYHTGIMCAILPALDILNNSDSCFITVVPVFDEESYEGSYEIDGKVVVLIILIEALKVFISGTKKRKG